MPGTSTEPVVDKGIRQKSIHSFHSIHSFPDGSAFCPGAPKHVPSDSEKHQRVYMSSNVCHSHEWRVDTASDLTLKKQNACLHAVRHAVEKKLRVYTASEAKGLIICLILFMSMKQSPDTQINATAYYRPVPSRTAGIPERDQRPCDNGYKSVFHRSWIKGLGKNPQKE